MRLLLSWLLAALVIGATVSPAHAEWHEAKSKHFIIYADLRPAELNAFAQRLERFDQAVRKVRRMDDPPLTDSGRLTIYAVRNEAAVARITGLNASGYYSARAARSIAIVPRRAGSKADKHDLDAEAIFFHEYAHHLQLQYASEILPAWLVEGFAEFFATARILDDGSVGIGAPPGYRAYGLFNLTGLTIEEMVGETLRRFSPEERELLYGRGWLLTHYLTFEPSRKGQLARYIAGIQVGTAPLESARAAFGDLASLNRELDSYMKRPRLGYRVIDGKLLSIDSIAIRPLRSGEAAIMDVHIRSRRGVNNRTAPGIATEARKIAVAHPLDPFVQRVLAEAEYDADRFAAAEAAADRALAIDPKSVQALIYKGSARMELARLNSENANWDEVRSWFAKANRLDTENAETLMLYYQSYSYAGTKPTANAVKGLLYAVVLAPQDEGLRIAAVRHLLHDNQVAEARKLFAPLAYQPHASEKSREATTKIVAAMAAGDAKAALSLLDAEQDRLKTAAS
jgi:hypothetical protein